MEQVKSRQVRKVLKTIGNVVFWLVLVFVVAYSVVALFSKEEANLRSVLGINMLSVQSNSMKPTFEEGDLIFIRTNKPISEITVGDVITYEDLVPTTGGESVKIFNTHRVTAVNIINNAYWFNTQGDNEAPDLSPVFQSDVIGVWTGGKISGFGFFADSFLGFLKSSLGFFLFVVLPCLLFLVYEVYRFIRVMSDYNVQKAVGNQDSIREEAIALAKAQLEAEIRKELEEKTKSNQKED